MLQDKFFWDILQYLEYIRCHCSVAQSCLTPCNSMDCSTPGFLSFTISWSLHTRMPTELIMLSNHLILWHALLLLPSIFASISSGSFSMKQTIPGDSLSNSSKEVCLRSKRGARIYMTFFCWGEKRANHKNWHLKLTILALFYVCENAKQSGVIEIVPYICILTT